MEAYSRAPRSRSSGRLFVALLLAGVTLAVLMGSALYTHGSLQHTEAAHISYTAVVVRPDSRQLFSAAASVAAAAAAAAGEESMDDVGEGATSTTLAPVAGMTAGGGCGRKLRPYHVLITSSSGTYQAWQTRIMYYHITKQKRAEGVCSEIGGITRLLTMPGGRNDSLMGHMPTYVVKELIPGREDLGFVVMNRPHSVKAFMEDKAALAKFVTEEYIMIAETDHVWLRPLHNFATASVPHAFHFGYMEAQFQKPLIERFCPGGGDTMDPVGPSPLTIHVDLLKKLVGPWLAMSYKLKMDPDADSKLGWVLEMWGYSVSSTCLGVKHLVDPEFQFEGGSIGSHERMMEMFKIFHYTYGVEYSVAGVPMELQVGHWSLDKRHYGRAFPPRNLSPPPLCAEQRARLLVGAFNEASANIPDWPSTYGPDTWRVPPADAPLPVHAFANSALARRVVGTGPWRWAGAGCCGGGAQDQDNAIPIFFMRDGLIWSEVGTGAWGLDTNNAEALLVTFITVTSRLTFQLKADGQPWTFEASPLGRGDVTGFAGGVHKVPRALRGLSSPTGHGELVAPTAVLKRWLADVPAPPEGELPKAGSAEQLNHAARLEGSGFYRTWGCLLRAGVVWRGRHFADEWQLWQLAPDSLPENGGEWGSGLHVHIRPLADSEHVPTLPYTKAEAVATGGKAHPLLQFSACWAFTEFTEASNPTRRHEWIIPQAAKRVLPGCASPNLARVGRFLNLPEEALAQWLLASGEWHWAGVKGFKFDLEGLLITPWGRGTWGVVPKQPRLAFANFAQQLHILDFGNAASGAQAESIPLKRFQSARCSDGELVEGTRVSA
mmetsp:Transcript_25055/g.63575  ORF Transcript_25055/g.63575 Transcript_25055/m.63575 type:complete len:832 (-) Transcript_25055:131-2626(-)